MSRLSRVLIGAVVGVIFLGAGTIGLTSVIQYKPYGVPDHRREEYDSIIKNLTSLKQEAKPTNKSAKVKADAAVHDFGMLDPHTTATHSFDVTNAGDGPLKLEILDSTCKCTVGELNNPLVAPGESTKVTLTWNTGYKAEVYEQSVLLKTNDPSKKTLALSVRGEVRAELVMPETVRFNKCDVGENAEAEFVVYSQLYNELEISCIASDLRDFNWIAEPIDVNDSLLGDSDAKTAWKVTMFTYCEDYGSFAGDIRVTVKPDKGESTVRTISTSGKVRGAISFQSPHIHKTKGLDLGTIVSGKQRQFHLTVRYRSIQERTLEVLDAKPESLQYAVVPQKTPGTYRLSITIPEDCPRTVYSSDQKHGYVQVGDPNDKNFSNWFPLHVSVVDLSK